MKTGGSRKAPIATFGIVDGIFNGPGSRELPWPLGYLQSIAPFRLIPLLSKSSGPTMFIMSLIFMMVMFITVGMSM